MLSRKVIGGDDINIETKPTQVQIKGINLRNVFDDGFLGAMEKSMGKNNHYVAVQIVNVENDEKENISLFHINQEQAENNILHIDSKYPETLEKVMKAVVKYYEGFENDNPE